MKYAVFSDVHGNQYALRRMIQDTAQEAQGYFYLGDTCGYYYGQRECMKLLRSLPNAILLKGNHDADYLSSRMDEKTKQELAAKYGSSYLEEQNEAYLQWLTGLKEQAEVEINGIKIGMFHGSVQNAQNGRCYPDTPIDAGEYASYDIVFQGHTHYRMARMAGDTLHLFEGISSDRTYRAPRPCGLTLVLNPGSLGQPRDGQGFSYCMFDFKRLEFEFRTVEFDKKELFREIEAHKETEKNAAYLTSVLTRGNNL